jgi:hypothetical protein
MTTTAIIVSAAAFLVVGMAALFGMMQYFFAKNRREELYQQQQQQEMMRKIDEIFPTLEGLLRSGVEVPPAAARTAEEAAQVTRLQSEEDKQTQVAIATENNGGTMPLDGGFISQ